MAFLFFVNMFALYFLNLFLKDLCAILPRRCLFRISSKTKLVAAIKQMILSVLRVSVFLPGIKHQMQFTTSVGDDMAEPVFEKGAAFVFK